MKIMLHHISISVSQQTLDCSKVYTQRLHLRNIGMSAAVWGHIANTRSGFYCMPVLCSECRRITRIIWSLIYLPNRNLFAQLGGNKKCLSSGKWMIDTLLFYDDSIFFIHDPKDR